MSSEEKRSWIYVVVAVGVSAVYFATVLSKVPGTDVARITTMCGRCSLPSVPGSAWASSPASRPPSPHRGRPAGPTSATGRSTGWASTSGSTS